MEEIMTKVKIISSLAATMLLSACASDNQNEATADMETVTIGVVSNRAAEIWQDVSNRLEEKEQISVETIVFNDFRQPNEAVANDELDANAYQYIPYLYEFNKATGENLLPIGYLSVEAMGIWAIDGIETVEDVPEGSQVSIYNDPTNLGNSLTQLEKADLLTLAPEAGPTPTVDDIIDNPKNLQLVELEAGQIPRSLGDSELIVCSTTMGKESGLDISDTFYFEDTSQTSEWFRLTFVVPEDKVEDETLLKVLDEYQTQETIDFANENANGTFFAGWENEDITIDDYGRYEDAKE